MKLLQINFIYFVAVDAAHSGAGGGVGGLIGNFYIIFIAGQDGLACETARRGSQEDEITSEREKCVLNENDQQCGRDEQTLRQTDEIKTG